MNEPFSEELLSAYLDGELPSDERLRVEEWLSASADHQKLFDDLQTIRRELQALPKQALDTGFSDRVLAAIRQRNPEALQQGGSASEPTPPPVPASIEKNKLGMPAWRWFAAGVAATLLAVIVGVNAAPETMAKIGMVPQLPHDQAAAKMRPAASAKPQAASPAAEETESPKYAEDKNSTEALAKADVAKSQAENQRAELAQNAGRGSANPPGPPKENRSFADASLPAAADADAVGTERADAKGFANETPSAPNAPAPGAARIAATLPDRAAEKKKGEADQGADRKQIAAADKAADGRLEDAGGAMAARDSARPIDRVVHVTAQQANSALALATLRRRALEAQVLEQNTKDNNTEGEGGNRQLQQAAQSVQIDALEITGPEHEVANLLTALGLDAQNQFRRAIVMEERSAEKPGNRGGGNSLASRANQDALPAKPGEQSTGDREAAAGGSGYAAAAKSGNQAKRLTADGGGAGKGTEAEKAQGTFGSKSGAPGDQRIVRVKLIVGSEGPAAAAAAPTQK